MYASRLRPWKLCAGYKRSCPVMIPKTKESQYCYGCERTKALDGR